MTNQEIFDQVSVHLLKQGEECMANSTCRYRYNGLSCAVGCLIPDSLYNARMECRSVGLLLRHFPDLKDHFDLQIKGLALLERLQHIHDAMPPDCWAGHLEITKRMFGLL